jgi:L-threonine kinase
VRLTDRREALVVGMGSCPLTLGECVQGRLPNGRFFLITSPIDFSSRAEFTIDDSLDTVVVTPPELSKSRCAAARYLKEEGLSPGGRLRVSTPLGWGQGFGTSTGDITASVRAAAAAHGRDVTPAQIGRIAIGIEPTDGSMYSQCVAFAHREGVLLEPLGSLPRFEAVVALPGGIVDTTAFDEHRRDYVYGPADQADLLTAWRMVRYANRTGDVGTMAAASTMSARINEQLLPKLLLREMLEFADRTGIDGLMAAHSGTALALILDPNRPGYSARMDAAHTFVAGLGLPSWFQTGNGNAGEASRRRRAVGDSTAIDVPHARDANWAGPIESMANSLGPKSGVEETASGPGAGLAHYHGAGGR